MGDRELMQQALDLLDDINQCSLPPTGMPLPAEIDHVMEALRARLAQPEPEPDYEAKFIKDWNEGKVRRVSDGKRVVPQREWQGLTENEIKHLWYEACQTNLELTSQLIVHLARNIEAKLKEKNT